MRVAAALAAPLSVPATADARQLSISSELQGAFYPREPIGRPAIGEELRGWASIDFARPLSERIDASADLVVYASNRRGALVDGEARIVWRGTRVAVAAGLLREEWGRFPDSPLDPLGPANTPFSLVHPEGRLSQPTVRATVFFGRLSVDVSGLIGERRQPLPESDGRFGFGAAMHDVVQRGALSDQALAVRISGTEPNVDWAAHVFGGLSRRPTFVPRFTRAAQLAAVDAVYSEILQVGGDVETTHADWRFLAEGFGRRGAFDVTGRERTYASVSAAAEYQRLGAFGGAYNLIPRVDVMADTRGDRADIPFGSAVRTGMRIVTTGLRPVQVDIAYSYDWAFRGHGSLGAVEKTLAEAPTVNLGFRFTTFVAGSKRSVLDVWEDDLEMLGYVRVELSR